MGRKESRTRGNAGCSWALLSRTGKPIGRWCDVSKTERELLAEISDKLDKLITAYAMQGRSQDEQIIALKNLGYDWKHIGTAVNLKPNTAQKRYERYH